jgi:hypothetical protein
MHIAEHAPASHYTLPVLSAVTDDASQPLTLPYIVNTEKNMLTVAARASPLPSLPARSTPPRSLLVGLVSIWSCSWRLVLVY